MLQDIIGTLLLIGFVALLVVETGGVPDIPLPKRKSGETPRLKTDRDIWPCGRYEVYDENAEPEYQRLNGFHTIEDAEECSAAFPGTQVIDRADRFCW